MQIRKLAKPDIPPQMFHHGDVVLDPPVLSSESRGWKGITVKLFHHPPREIGPHFFYENLITLYIGRGLNLMQMKDGQVHEGHQIRGDITITPAGIENAWRWDSEAHLVNILFDPEFFSQVASGAVEVDPERITLVPNFLARDPLIERMGLSLLSELESDGIAGRLYAESQAIVLAVHLLRHYSTLEHPVHEFAGGLPRHKLQRVTDYINSNLDGALSLTEIAAVAGIGAYHFARLFKQATGLTPHQYVLESRIERAKQLLAETEASIVEVCHRVGFQSQSHFTTLFHRYTGTTPKVYRRSL